MITEIRDINEKSVSIYSQLNENQLKRIYEPEEGLFIAESAVVIERALKAGYIPQSFFIEKYSLEKMKGLFSAYPEVQIYTAGQAVMSGITGYHLTGGILCAMKRRPLPGCDEILETSENIAVIVDVENPTNVGAIFRSAAALGIDGILLAGGSSDPLYRRTVRVSMGAVFKLPWTIVSGSEWKHKLFGLLNDHGFMSAATALAEDAVPLEKMRAEWGGRNAVLFWSEGSGLPADVIDKCSFKVTIPMEHGVDSLNVAAASAVIFWEMKRGREGS